MSSNSSLVNVILPVHWCQKWDLPLYLMALLWRHFPTCEPNSLTLRSCDITALISTWVEGTPLFQCLQRPSIDTSHLRLINGICDKVKRNDLTECCEVWHNVSIGRFRKETDFLLGRKFEYVLVPKSCDIGIARCANVFFRRVIYIYLLYSSCPAIILLVS